MGRYPTKKEIKAADELQIRKWWRFLLRPLHGDFKRHIALINRYSEYCDMISAEMDAEIGDVCKHDNTFLKVIDTCVTCETVATICNDCRDILIEKTDC